MCIPISRDVLKTLQPIKTTQKNTLNSLTFFNNK